MKIGVKKISIDLAVSIRERNEEETIQRYMDVLGDLPPITVFRSPSDGKYLLADGFHRLAAAERLGWEYIDADVKEGSYEEASEYAITANLKHGKPLTSAEYESALLRLREMHKDWTQERMARTLNRSQQWVSYVIAAHSVENIPNLVGLETGIKAEISKAPKPLWSDIGSAAKEQNWTVEETREKIKEIKAEPERAREIIQPVKIEIPEAPADKLIPLTKDIKKVYELHDKLCEMDDQFCDKLDPNIYDWGSGALATHVLQGLYILAEKIIQQAEKTAQLGEKTKKIIEYLEARRR